MNEYDHFDPSKPYPVKIEICGHCGEPWDKHMRRAWARTSDWATEKRNAENYPEEYDAPEGGPEPKGDTGPTGPMGMMGPRGKSAGE